MTHPRYTRTVAALPETVPFVGPETLERGRGAPFDARIGANESVFGPSPKAMAAMRDAVAECWKYGDAPSHDLRQALAAHHGIAPENIVVGEGIDGLLGDLVRLLIEPGDAVVTSDGAYPTFNYHVAGYGGVLHKVPFRDDREDLPALLAKAGETGAKLVYFVNPDNPMGTWSTAEEITAALADLPEGCLLILDEAYAEFAPEGVVPQIAIDHPGVVRMRTFSKAHGMAGARIGYAMGAPGLIRAYDKVRNHFGVNRTAQIGALAALEDTAWLGHVRAEVTAACDRIADIARAHGLSPLPTATNFVAMDLGGNGDLTRALVAALGKRGIFVRMGFVPPLDRCLRVSAGTKADLDAFEAALPAALEEARAAVSATA
ncbi:pyridoxal phosphate-dependent aminotransferase [Mesobacterium pallidum]|uniref:pyridoxal phosphate-dependent aminotransferase n=1 Tax=Mesobacterium pallidum TaxID=2872037 RepID=UPI001EE3879D|nr:pyridoxal phosphate-dependent aminotransferase [Mesobacterium pallidum]